MKYLPFNFDQSVTSSEDIEFARKLSDKFNLEPFDDFQRLIEYIRTQLNFLTALNKSSAGQHLSKYSFLKDITAISLKTEKLTIEIRSTDEEFKYFKTPLDRLQSIILKDLKKADKKIFDNMVDYIMFETQMLNSTWFPTIPNQQHIFIGMFLVHFKLHKRSKPYDTENNYNSEKYQDYDHYLASIGEARMKKKVVPKGSK